MDSGGFGRIRKDSERFGVIQEVSGVFGDRIRGELGNSG